jgi:hypothetical protein
MAATRHAQAVPRTTTCPNASSLALPPANQRIAKKAQKMKEGTPETSRLARRVVEFIATRTYLIVQADETLLSVL